VILLSILAHHSEPGDADLLDWIRHQIDAIVGLEPLAIIIILGLVIVAIPVAILVAFRIQRTRQGGA
jgi:hypothetical protein|tara:strand:- start:463 stop:663 length:201 start_codon:yes stop_codon:yes gene_type:complete